jgi:choline dehydrogenase-like flavoprotein
MNERWLVVGAGSAGCAIANRLSAGSDRTVVLVDDGPALSPDAVPDGIAGPSFFHAMAEPGRLHLDLMATKAAGQVPSLYQRGRGIGGSSAVNAMVALDGNASLYQQWGWHDVDLAWANVQIPRNPAADTELGAVDLALLEHDTAERAELTRRNGQRVTAAQAYLWPVLDRPNLQVRANAAVEALLVDRRRVIGARLADGSDILADHVVVAAGAIHTPALLLRSGIDTPGIGHGLQDHPSAVFTLVLATGVPHDPDALPVGSLLHQRVDDQLLQLLPMNNLGPGADRAGLGAVMAALMTPIGTSGTVTVDAMGKPVIDFALLDDQRDLVGLRNAARLAIDVIASPSFDALIDQVYIDDVGSGLDQLASDAAIDQWLRSNCGDYVHATSTCAMGRVVDEDFRVVGYEGLLVCDASVFPSIPDANTHLPTTMVAERFALCHC